MMYGKEMMGIHTAAYKAVSECDMDVRAPLLHNVILSGGTLFARGEFQAVWLLPRLRNFLRFQYDEII